MEHIFTKIGTSKTLSQRIERKIEEAIRSKELVVGQKLPTENELCEMFGVSRTVLREALQMLRSRGLISIEKGRGVFISDYSSDHASKPMSLYFDLNFDRNTIFHMTQVRQIVEPPIAKLAAKNRTEDDLCALEKNLENFKDRSQDSSLLAQLDLNFHLGIIRASGNPIIKIILDPLYTQLPKIKTLIVKHVKHKSDTAYEFHESIFEMIKLQDEQGAFDAMKAHLQVAEKDALSLCELLEKNREI